MMMNVGLEMSPASRPRPMATPRARTVFPVPSSPERANTSFGRAARPRRSPSRSVCIEEWLTRSSDARCFCRSATGESAKESATLEEESEIDAEIRAEDRREGSPQPFPWYLAERDYADAAPEHAKEREESKRTNEPASTTEGRLVGLERFTTLLVGPLLAALWLRWAVFGRIASIAAPSTSCHPAEASARRSSGRSRSDSVPRRSAPAPPARRRPYRRRDGLARKPPALHPLLRHRVRASRAGRCRRC